MQILQWVVNAEPCELNYCGRGDNLTGISLLAAIGSKAKVVRDYKKKVTADQIKDVRNEILELV